MDQFRKDVKDYWKVLLLLVLVLEALQYFFGTVCAFRFLFGIPCPACGMTRAFRLLIQGRVLEAFQMHPLFPLVIIGGVYLVISRYFSVNIKKSTGKYATSCAILVGIVSLLLYIYRMAAWFPERAPMEFDGRSILARILYSGGR
jgi:hypothetical protein